MSQNRTFEFTDRALKGLPVPPKPKQFDYFDSKARGLGLRISYGGRRAFFAMYSNAAGKRQRVSLGELGRLEDGKLSLAEARKRAKARLGEVAKDKDPAAEHRAARVSAAGSWSLATSPSLAVARFRASAKDSLPASSRPYSPKLTRWRVPAALEYIAKNARRPP